MLLIFLQHLVSLTPITIVQGDIEHFGNFDMVHAVHAVNGDEVANIWNKDKSKNCKIIVTSWDYKEMKSHGFKRVKNDAVIVHPQFPRVTDRSKCHPAYIYRSTDYRKDRAKYMSELLPELTVDDISKPFKKVFTMFKEGEVAEKTTLSNGYPINDALLERNCM